MCTEWCQSDDWPPHQLADDNRKRKVLHVTVRHCAASWRVSITPNVWYYVLQHSMIPNHLLPQDLQCFIFADFRIVAILIFSNSLMFSNRRCMERQFPQSRHRTKIKRRHRKDFSVRHFVIYIFLSCWFLSAPLLYVWQGSHTHRISGDEERLGSTRKCVEWVPYCLLVLVSMASARIKRRIGCLTVFILLMQFVLILRI